MPNTTTLRGTVLALGTALLLSTAFSAYAHPYYNNDTSTMSPTAPMEDANGIVHVTGGVGDDERDALEAARGDYNVHITNTNRDGAFNDSTEITITDKTGDAVVTADAGPLFYVQLPVGSYTIVAKHREQQQQKKIKITKSKKMQPDLHFVW